MDSFKRICSSRKLSNCSIFQEILVIDGGISLLVVGNLSTTKRRPHNTRPKIWYVGQKTLIELTSDQPEVQQT